MKKIISTAMLLLFSFSTVIYAAEKSGAKSIFYTGEGTTVSATKTPEVKRTPKTQTNKEKYMGISYWIDMKGDDGKLLRTTAKKVFKSGDKIKLNLTSNRDGYLYVVNIGSSGTSRILYPRSSEDNHISANNTYSVPYNTFMKFDENPGEETLLVFLSPKMINELTPKSNTINADESNRYELYAKNNGSKDIMLEDDESATAKTAQYVVAPMSSLEDGKGISLFLKLKHK